VKHGPEPVYLVGPTAAGKTGTALALADRIPLEIVSADSMQVYRGLDILSAKASADERARVRHHLVDILDVTEPFSAAEFKRLAQAAIADIRQRGKLPLVVGGTGLYVKALTEGIFEVADKPSGVRERLMREAETSGAEKLHVRLADVDAVAAARIAPNDVRRILRALEVYETTGRPISEQQTEWAEPQPCLMLGLRLPRTELYRRIEARVEAMFEARVVEEVRRLVDAGIEHSRTAMQAIGVAAIIALLRGEATVADTKRAIATQTRRYAKRQLTWFRKDPRIHWYDVAPDVGHVEALAQAIEAYTTPPDTE